MARTLGVVIALLGALVAGWTPVASATPRASDVIEGMFDVGGRALYLRCEGSGSPTVVFESGWGGVAEDWRAIQAEVSEGTRACAYDRANVGRSDDAPTPRSGADVVADLRALLAAAGVPGRYVLVGASLGGHMARLSAHAYPADTAGVVLLDAVHEDLVPRFEELLGPVRTELVRAGLFGDDEEGFIRGGLVSEALDEEVRAARRAGTFPAVPLAVVTPGTFDLLSAGGLGVEDVPGWPEEEADALWGELQADLATLSPAGRLVIAQGSGHVVQATRPALVVQVVLAVVEEARAVPGASPVATPVG